MSESDRCRSAGFCGHFTRFESDPDEDGWPRWARWRRTQLIRRRGVDAPGLRWPPCVRRRATGEPGTADASNGKVIESCVGCLRPSVSPPRERAVRPSRAFGLPGRGRSRVSLVCAAVRRSTGRQRSAPPPPWVSSCPSAPPRGRPCRARPRLPGACCPHRHGAMCRPVESSGRNSTRRAASRRRKRLG